MMVSALDSQGFLHVTPPPDPETPRRTTLASGTSETQQTGDTQTFDVQTSVHPTTDPEFLTV